jgi:hypothetical protein
MQHGRGETVALFPRFNECAYAGIFFNVTGAASSTRRLASVEVNCGFAYSALAYLWDGMSGSLYCQ